MKVILPYSEKRSFLLNFKPCRSSIFLINVEGTQKHLVQNLLSMFIFSNISYPNFKTSIHIYARNLIRRRNVKVLRPISHALFSKMEKKLG